jgi:hypothetical protein
MLTLDAPSGSAAVGTGFTSSGSAGKDTFHIEPDGTGSRIVYTETIERVNYLPYWLKPGIRTIFRPWVNRADRKQLRNLARLAEERSTD